MSNMSRDLRLPLINTLEIPLSRASQLPFLSFYACSTDVPAKDACSTNFTRNEPRENTVSRVSPAFALLFRHNSFHVSDLEIDVSPPGASRRGPQKVPQKFSCREKRDIPLVCDFHVTIAKCQELENARGHCVRGARHNPEVSWNLVSANMIVIGSFLLAAWYRKAPRILQLMARKRSNFDRDIHLAIHLVLAYSCGSTRNTSRNYSEYRSRVLLIPDI